jgi:hypothetical protein
MKNDFCQLYFNDPVDPEALGIPQYREIIKVNPSKIRARTGAPRRGQLRRARRGRYNDFAAACAAASGEQARAQASPGCGGASACVHASPAGRRGRARRGNADWIASSRTPRARRIPWT